MILITEFMDETAIKKLEKRYNVIYDSSLFENPAAISKIIGGAKAIIVRNKTLITRNLLDKAPLLTCVGRLGVGLDNIDIKGCEEKRITVYPATGANSNSVAEYVICTSMLLLRGAFFKKNKMVSGLWPREESSGSEVNGKTMGLIGFGEIAQKVKRIAVSIGMKIVAHDPYLQPHSKIWKGTDNLTLDELLKYSDIISLHVPLTKETKNLIDKTKIELLKPTAIIINAARGGIIDEDALASALEKGRIRGAALDVFTNEPLDKEAAKKFGGLENIILTPHIGGITIESNKQVSLMIADKVNQHLSKM